MGNTQYNIYDQNRIISIGEGITFTEFHKLLTSYIKSIPTDLIKIIADYTAIYNLQGYLINEFPICPERPLLSQNHTAYCTVSPSGIIFVSDSSSREVRRFNYSGEALDSFHKTPMTYYKIDDLNYVVTSCPLIGGYDKYDRPYNITLDSKENLYLTDYYNNIIIKYNRDGNLYYPKPIIGVAHPLAITYDKNRDLIYISSDHSIKCFNSDGTLVNTTNLPDITLNLYFHNDNLFKLSRYYNEHNYVILNFYSISINIHNTSQIPINEIGNLYISNIKTNSINIFKASNLSHIKTVKLYDSKGKTIKPTTIAVDEQGHLIVVSCTENKIFIYK